MRCCQARALAEASAEALAVLFMAPIMNTTSAGVKPKA